MLRTLNRQKLRGLRSPSRRRRNPDAPYGVLPAKWKSALDFEKVEARRALLGARQEIVQAGIPSEALPEPAELNKLADSLATILASSGYADLAAQSKLNTPSMEVAAQIFSVFDKVAEEKAAKPVLAKAVRTLAARLDTRRASALAARKAAGSKVQEAIQESNEEKLERLMAERAALASGEPTTGSSDGEDEDDEDEDEDEDEDDEEIETLYAEAKQALKRLGRKDPNREVLAKFVKAYDSGDPDEIADAFSAVKALADSAPEVEKAEEVVEKRVARRSSRTAPAEPRAASTPRRGGQAPPPRPVVREVVEDEKVVEEIPTSVTVSRAGERLAGYAQYRARVRTRVDLPEALRRETARDILLFVLNDRTTQVWIKGSLTDTFVASRGRASWKTAALYAKQWLEIPGTSGSVKKSRLGMRVVVSTQDEPDKFEVIQAARSGVGAAAPKKLESLSTIVEQLRSEPKSRSNPRYCREGYLRNPMGRQVVADVREVFRRSNPGWLVPTLTGVAGFVAGTYAEAEFGLSKQFTRGGLATAGAAREAATAVRERRLPELPKLPAAPKVKTVKDFKSSARLNKMIEAYYAFEDKKKAVPFAQAKKRDAMERKLGEMWDEIETLREQEMAEQGIRQNPGFSVAQANQMPAAFSPVLRNPRKLPVPEHVAKTPRKAGERISAIGVKGKWPIGDLFHARLAAIYIMSPSHRAKKAQVLRALEMHWPQYDWRAFIGEKPLRMVANPRRGF